MTLQYSPDIIDWPHVVQVIEQEERFRNRYKEARRRVIEQNRKYNNNKKK